MTSPSLLRTAPSRLTLREGSPAVRMGLPPEVAVALSSSGVVDVARTDDPGVWEVAPRQQVGVVSAGGLEVVIQPKISIQRLVFLMGFSRHPSFWRDEDVHLDRESSLPEALANAFTRLALRALDQGLLKGYRTVDETLPVLRGRIRESDQVRRRWGLGLPLEVRYDDYTVDIAENRLLLAAVERLQRVRGVAARERRALHRLRVLLSDVSVVRDRRVRFDWEPSRLNARYVPALVLAELILAGWSFEQRYGDVVVSGFLVDMARVFEDFVTVALREAFGAWGGRAELQWQGHLDVGRTVEVRPDFMWSVEGVPAVVVDAKYKAEKPSGFPNADLYQMLAYCTVLGLSEGHLVYAKGNEREQTYDVVGSDVRIHAHALDLDVGAGELLGAVEELSKATRKPVSL